MLNTDSTVIQRWLDAYRGNFITESNMRIYKLDDNDNLTMLIDKEHITNYTYQSHNAWINKNYPTEEHTIEIRNWNSLPNDTKTFLSTKGNILFFKYFVKKDNNSYGYYSDNPRFAVIYDVKRDVKTGTRTIYCRSILSLLTSKASYVLNQRPSALLPTMANKQEYANAGIYYNPTSTINAITKTLDRIPANITDGELLQNIALATGHYLTTKVNGTNNKPRFALVKTTTSTYWNFPMINIKENSYREYKANESKTIEILGSIKEPTPINVGSVSYTTTSTIEPTLFLTNYYTTDCVVNSLTAQTSSGVSVAITISSQSNDQVVGKINNPSANLTYEMTTYANKLTTERSQTSGTTTISCMLLGGNITKDNYLSAKATKYYGYDTIVEFDCRIDPNFECGDVMGLETLLKFIDTETYLIDSKVIIEELTITFNGAFNGHIKGRKAPTYE